MFFSNIIPYCIVGLGKNKINKINRKEEHESCIKNSETEKKVRTCQKYPVIKDMKIIRKHFHHNSKITLNI